DHVDFIHNCRNVSAMPRPALIIEDDPDIAESVRYNLETAGFSALVAPTGEQGLTLALDAVNPPALIVLDLMLPGMNGMDLCRRLRKENRTRRTPIIMLTAKASETDRVAGLDVGADDYIAKPFSVRELLARVRAVMRRAEDEGGERYDDGRLTIDFEDVRASCDGSGVRLTNKEFQLLVTSALLSGPPRWFGITAFIFVVGLAFGAMISNKSAASKVTAHETDAVTTAEFSIDLLNATLNEMREGLLVIDSEMRVVASNHAARHLFSNVDDSINSRRLTELTRNPGIYDAFLDAVRGKERAGVKVETFAPERRVFDLHVAPLHATD